MFWVCGKAGSGKSILMKFLSDDSWTLGCLQGRKPDRPLMSAEHYFWYAASSMQKSPCGLLRSFLHQILAFERDAKSGEGQILVSRLCEYR